MGGITHVVQIGFEAGTPAATIQDACDGLFALPEKCLHPDTKKPYIKSLRGGKENSVEGMQNGITHVFVTEFESREDRDYYALKDPVHVAISKRLIPLVKKVQVVDFENGSF